MIHGSYVYYYVYNLQGDVIGLMNAATGKLVATYSYDAWGNCTVTNAIGWTAGNLNPFRYRGYYFDTETNLYYLNSRYYDPAMGRFINADDATYLGINGEFISYNLFAYCLNNSVKYDDQSGKFVFSLFGAVAGYAAGFISAMATGVDLSLIHI